MELQNIEKPIPSYGGTIFTADTSRGRVMVRRNPRIDPTSYQRDDEYRVPTWGWAIYAEWSDHPSIETDADRVRHGGWFHLTKRK